jgi:hypothetical protein
MQINLYLTNWASPDATTELPADPDAAARGRNGWFRPRQIAIWRGDQIRLTVRSRRMGDNAPIQLHISATVAHALGNALLAAAADPAGARASPAEPAAVVSVEVEWHPDYRGGDYDPKGGQPEGLCSDTGELTFIEFPVSPGGYVTDALVYAAFTAATGQDPTHIIRWVEVEESLG